MAGGLSYTLAQINPTVGALPANRDKIIKAWSATDCDLIIFPEMCICGYPPEDLVLKPFFIEEIAKIIEELCAHSASYPAAALISAPTTIDGRVYNTALLIDGGKIIHTQAKHHLPNYGVFDEVRVFAPGQMPDVVAFRGAPLGILT